MSNEAGVNEISHSSVNKIVSKNSKDLSVEACTLLVITNRLHSLENESRKELQELKARQQKVAFLHKLIKAINTATAPNGEFDGRNYPELHEMFANAKTFGIEIDENKLKTEKYNVDERERLVENIRMTIEDFNIQNEMQLQLVTRLTNERYESYQMARSILKPLHDDKLNKARQIAGR